MNKGLNRDFNEKSLLLYALPNIIMMVFLSLYTIVDGMFISKFVGTLALSASNIVFPIQSLQLGVYIMLTSGASAIVARKLGERKLKEARENFTFICVVGTVIGIIFLILGNIFIDKIVILLGSTPQQFNDAKKYASILLCFSPAFFIEIYTQNMFAVAGKPHIGLFSTILSGITNIILDYILIVPFNMGIAGAAYATGIGYVTSALVGIYYFYDIKYGLKFTRLKCNWKVLLKSCTNGSSEMVSNLANAITTYLFNIAMLKYYGNDGVAAITIVLYFQFVFSSVFLGYSTGVSPVIAFKYGEKNKKQLAKVLNISMRFIFISSVVMFTFSRLTIGTTLLIFTNQGTNVYNITREGFKLFAYSFLFVGFGVFGSAWFTSLSDGKVSATISFLRTLVFIVLSIIILPKIFGSNGLWATMSVAEFLSMLVAFAYLRLKKEKYGY